MKLKVPNDLFFKCQDILTRLLITYLTKDGFFFRFSLKFTLADNVENTNSYFAEKISI